MALFDPILFILSSYLVHRCSRPADTSISRGRGSQTDWWRMSLHSETSARSAQPQCAPSPGRNIERLTEKGKYQSMKRVSYCLFSTAQCDFSVQCPATMCTVSRPERCKVDWKRKNISLWKLSTFFIFQFSTAQWDFSVQCPATICSLPDHCEVDWKSQNISQ